MAAVEAVLTKVFLDVALSSGVDVLTKRAQSPVIRGLGKAYKVYTLVSPAEGIINALRLAAYSDAARLIAQEVVVEFASQKVAKTLLEMRSANYEVHREAERYVLKTNLDKPELVYWPLGRWIYKDPEFIADDREVSGSLLIEKVLPAVINALRAREIAVELTRYPESAVVRPYRNWDRPLNLLERTNFELGHIFWQPAPEVGLGQRSINDRMVYSGIFRRNDPEGYGSVTWAGNRYYGQTRMGFPEGYGVYYFRDGRVYAGAVTDAFDLGASWSANRDRVYYGEHHNRLPDGYGRLVGLANGVESRTALWHDGEGSHDLPPMAEIYRNIAAKMDSPHSRELREEYEKKAFDCGQAVDLNDAQIVSRMRQIV